MIGSGDKDMNGLMNILVHGVRQRIQQRGGIDMSIYIDIGYGVTSQG